MSPLWGFGYLVHAVCYKHIAPLGLNAESNRQTDISAIVGARFPRLMGWGTQPLRIPRSRFPCVHCVLALKFPSRLAAHRELELVLQQHRVTLPSLPF